MTLPFMSSGMAPSLRRATRNTVKKLVETLHKAKVPAGPSERSAPCLTTETQQCLGVGLVPSPTHRILEVLLRTSGRNNIILKFLWIHPADPSDLLGTSLFVVWQVGLWTRSALESWLCFFFPWARRHWFVHLVYLVFLAICDTVQQFPSKKVSCK